AVIESVIAHLIRLGYVNDGAFARQWALSRIRLRGFGRRRIEQELRGKGVSRDIILEVLSEAFQEPSEADIARREAEKKRKSLSRFAPEVQRRRLAGFLERRGFSAGIIRSIVNSVK
ncbi:MAG TPA: regulatory protein RecX, partial [Nitrospirota bacterium]